MIHALFFADGACCMTTVRRFAYHIPPSNDEADDNDVSSANTESDEPTTPDVEYNQRKESDAVINNDSQQDDDKLSCFNNARRDNIHESEQRNDTEQEATEFDGGQNNASSKANAVSGI